MSNLGSNRDQQNSSLFEKALMNYTNQSQNSSFGKVNETLTNTSSLFGGSNQISQNKSSFGASINNTSQPSSGINIFGANLNQHNQNEKSAFGIFGNKTNENMNNTNQNNNAGKTNAFSLFGNQNNQENNQNFQKIIESSNVSQIPNQLSETSSFNSKPSGIFSNSNNDFQPNSSGINRGLFGNMNNNSTNNIGNGLFGNKIKNDADNKSNSLGNLDNNNLTKNSNINTGSGLFTNVNNPINNSGTSLFGNIKNQSQTNITNNTGSLFGNINNHEQNKSNKNETERLFGNTNKQQQTTLTNINDDSGSSLFENKSNQTEINNSNNINSGLFGTISNQTKINPGKNNFENSNNNNQNSNPNDSNNSNPVENKYSQNNLNLTASSSLFNTNKINTSVDNQNHSSIGKNNNFSFNQNCQQGQNQTQQETLLGENRFQSECNIISQTSAADNSNMNTNNQTKINQSTQKNNIFGNISGAGGSIFGQNSNTSDQTLKSQASSLNLFINPNKNQEIPKIITHQNNISDINLQSITDKNPIIGISTTNIKSVDNITMNSGGIFNTESSKNVDLFGKTGNFDQNSNSKNINKTDENNKSNIGTNVDKSNLGGFVKFPSNQETNGVGLFGNKEKSEPSALINSTSGGTNQFPSHDLNKGNEKKSESLSNQISFVGKAIKQEETKIESGHNQVLFSGNSTKQGETKPPSANLFGINAGNNIGIKQTIQNSNQPKTDGFKSFDKKTDGGSPRSNTKEGKTENNPPNSQNGNLSINQIKHTEESKKSDKADTSGNLNNENTNNGIFGEKKPLSDLHKLSKPSEQVKELKIDELKFDNLMNRTIDETINNWKLELETQTEAFNNNAEKIKQFEFSFLKNYDNMQILNGVIEKIESDTKESIENMKNVSHQEDNIIDELDMIEKGLDKYLEIVAKRLPQDYEDNNYLYQTTLELNKETKAIQNDINNVQRILLNDSEKKNFSQDVVMDKSTMVLYENIATNEFFEFDKNDIASILNGYYNSMKVIQTLQGKVENKINDIQSDLTDFSMRRNSQGNYSWN